MCAAAQESSVTDMTYTPLEAATAVLEHPVLPHGDDARFIGFGVKGFPFAGGPYLARCWSGPSRPPYG